MKNEQYDAIFNTPKVKITVGNPNSLVFCWGKNSSSELGQQNINYVETPCGFAQLSKSKISTIASRGSHTAILDTEGRVYMLGSSLLGKLGREFQDN